FLGCSYHTGMRLPSPESSPRRDTRQSIDNTEHWRDKIRSPRLIDRLEDIYRETLRSACSFVRAGDVGSGGKLRAGHYSVRALADARRAEDARGGGDHQG